MADSSSKPVSRNPGMRTFAHGIVTVVEKNFSKLLAHGESNEELLKARSFEKMYYAKHGPFTMGDVELEIRMYPVKQDLVEVHVCLLRNAELVNKFFHTLVYYHPGQKVWRVSVAGKDRLPTERDYKAESGSIGEGLGLPMVYLDYFTKYYTEDDHTLFEVALWLVLDDSKKPAAIPQQETSGKPAGASTGNTWQEGKDNFWDRPFSG